MPGVTRSAEITNGVKGTPQDKKQVQGESMSAIAASRGKRKLDFDSQCFKGKTMFLDLAGYHRTPEIEHELTERGATIEHFFHRGVKYLVTNRPKKEGQSTPSPHTPGTAHSVGKSSWSQLVSPMTDSRLGTDKRSTQQPPIYRSRAQKILQMSLEKQKNTGKKVDIVAMATGWGCKSTPSSSTPSTMRSVGKSSWSQLVSDCPSDMDMRLKPPIYQSRAQKMLHMSLEKQKNAGKKVDVVAMGCKSTPSPRTLGTTHSVGMSSWSQLVSPMTDSPSGADMRPKQQPLIYQNRAQKILHMSLEKQKNTKKVDIVAMATGWGCKVVQLEELLAELKRLKPLPKKEESQMTTHGGRRAGVHQLQPPFFKVEDLSRCYRPLVCEMKEWPHPDPLCSPKACPFDSPRRAKALQHATRHPQASPDNPYARVQLHHSPAHLEEKRPGYCECCAQRYDDLHKHLKSTRHQEYARNPANFASLDSLIEQGTSFAAFIADIKRKHEHQQREGMGRECGGGMRRKRLLVE